MKEELTAKMHSEFNVSEEIELRNTAGTVWDMCHFKDDPELLAKWCKVYQISIDDVKRYKDFWFSIVGIKQ